VIILIFSYMIVGDFEILFDTSVDLFLERLLDLLSLRWKMMESG
jgi:hypothetical protein